MASSTAPNHDFAPAWLKIPSNSQKQSGVNPEATPNLPSQTARKTAVEPRRERGRTGFLYRHHSIDAEDLQRQQPAQNSNGSDYSLLVTGYKHSGSQPSLGRRSNSRQDFRDNSFSTKGSGSFDFNDSHRSSNSHWGRQRSFERSHAGNNSNGRTHVAEHNDTSPNWTDKKLDKFDQEFPSLKGDAVNDTETVSTPTNMSVWDMSKSGKFHLSSNSVGKKIQLVQKQIHNAATLRNSSPNGTNGNASTPSAVKQPMKLTSGSNVTSVYRTLSAKGLRRANNDSVKSNEQAWCGQSSAIAQMEKLNTRLVTHPKNVSNKSDFLKELRDENGVDLKDAWDCDEKQEKINEINFDKFHLSNGNEKTQDSDHVNGIDIKKHPNTDSDDKALSRSLEAEQRLLREMGWKEEGSEDEATYAPLTEDEVKEFRNLPKLLPRRNELPKNFQFTWSPKRVINITPAALELGNDIGSSSTSDSDSD